MNFFAIPTLKNDRACLRLPISIRPLRSLKVMFDNERIGIVRVGSLPRWAALTTTSATPTSFLSTAVTFRGFAAISYAFPRLARFGRFAVVRVGLRLLVRPARGIRLAAFFVLAFASGA